MEKDLFIQRAPCEKSLKYNYSTIQLFIYYNEFQHQVYFLYKYYRQTNGTFDSDYF